MRFLPKIAALLCLFSCSLLSSINTSIAQTSSGSITVGGDFDKFYPVTWNDPAWFNSEPTVLKIGRSNVHENSVGRGALISTFNYHLSFWGNGAHFIDADIRNNIVNFIAGWRDASTGGGSGLLVIWLRGGNSTYYYHSNYAITPTVYDNVQNTLPFQEHNGPAHTFKTDIDSYVNSGGITNSGGAYYLSSGANFFNGSVGIGTQAPIGKLHVAGTFSGGIIQDGNDRPGIGVSGQYPQAVLMAGGTNNPSHGPTVMLGSYDSGTSGNHKHWSIGTAGQGSTFLDIGYGVNDLNPHAGIRNYNGSTIMTLLNNGNVGIGIINPTYALSLSNNKTISFNPDPTNPFGIEGGDNAQTRLIMGAASGSGSNIAFGVSNGSGSAGFTEKMRVSANGKVGIGTSNPNQQLDIYGSIGFANQNSADKKLYSPVDGVLEWMTHNWAGEHGFSISHQGNRAVYLNTSGNSYLNGGNIGIGTSNPMGKLHVAGAFSGGIIEDTNDRPSLGISGHYPQAVLMSGDVNNPNHGPTVMLGSYDSGTSGTSKHWSIGTAGQGSTFLDIGYGVNDLNPHSGIRNYNGSTIMTLLNTGYVGIGTIKPDSKLTVAGKIHAREVKVSIEAGADFVFAKDYTLKPLTEVADFINMNKHLPEVASANQMKKEGVELGDMNIKLLQKIEELTLYLIEQNKEIKALKISNEELKSEVLKIKTCK